MEGLAEPVSPPRETIDSTDERPAMPPVRRWFPWLLVPVAMFCFLFVDQLAGRWFTQQKLGGEFADFLDAAEHFGTPYGQLLILAAIFFVHARRERRVVRVFVGSCSAGLVADVVKLLIARSRPRGFDFETLTQADSFLGWFPLGTGGSASQSFPSAHTACAFGFAALLSWMYPQGRSLFLVLAVLTGFHRITTAAHFPSDVCIGALLGWLVGQAFVSYRPIAGRFERFEQRTGHSQPTQRSVVN